MRAKVACLNWHWADGPKATSYVLDDDGRAIANEYHPTWDEAVDRANYLGWLITREVRA